MIRPLALFFLLLSTNAFAESADLTMFKHPNADQPRLWVAIYNYGIDPARNIQVTVELPAPLTVRSVTGDATHCDSTAVPLRCTFADLGPNTGPRTLIVDFNAPFENATYTVTATATSDTPEANPANNVITHTFETRIVADLNTWTTPAIVRIDPGATQVFDVEVRNYRVTLPPRDLLLKLSATPGMTIEKIDAPLWTCTIAGSTAECRAPALDDNCWCGRDILVTVRANDDLHGGEGRLEANVTSNLPEVEERNNRSAGTVQTYRHFVVSTNADAGEGSLRAAIEQANQSCSPAPCKIVFDMAAEGLDTITPATPLPPITADRVFIDGGSKITIDGTAAHYGLDMRARCEAVVQGLVLKNFGDQGLAMANGVCPDNLDQRLVYGNTIVENFRGLRLDDAQALVVRNNTISDNVRSGVWSWNGKGLRIVENRIERNGASGIFLGPDVDDANVRSNTIAGHPDMGVAVARGAKVIDIRANAMTNNRGLGIDWGLDGVSPADADDSATQSNAPVLLSARYDAATDRTEVTMTLNSAPIGHYPLWIIDVYANDAPDGDGGRPIGSHEIYQQPNGAFVVSLRGNHSGKWLNATSTRVRSIYLELYIGPSITSELSNTVAVQ